ncbi:right-handed parallel beta-helix repeat-containing protein [bacterium]|nr:right-handed parallel beta-helix repeat-containing protein [bacterium]
MIRIPTGARGLSAAVFLTAALLFTLLFTPQIARAQGTYSLSTVSSNNGQQMISFEVTAYKSVRLYRFWCEFDVGTGTAEIWAHPNGVSTTNTGWIYLGAGNYTSTNATSPTEIPVTLDFPMNANETWGFLIFRQGSTGINYRSGATPYVFSNSDISIDTEFYGGSGTTNPTAGTTNLSFSFYPRQYCGTVYYDLASSVPYDAGITAVLSPSSFCGGVEPVRFELSNFGTQQLTSATINWTVNNVPQTPFSWTGLLDTAGGAGATSAAVTVGTYNFAANTPYTIRAWPTSPNSQPDTINYNDTTEVTVQSGMSGTYTIGGASPDFATFTDAVDALKTAGLCGAVVFNVAAGTYTEEIEIPEIAGASPTWTVTFDGGTGNASTRIIEYSHTADGAVIMLNGADYLRFKNLTMKATGSQDGTALWFTDDADYNIVEDCILEASTSATSSDAIPLVGSGSTTSSTSSGNTGSFNLIQNNQIRGGYYGIYWRGSGSTDTTDNKANVFLNNVVSDWYYYGFYNYYSSYLDVEGNEFWHRSGGTTSAYGMYVYYANMGPRIIGNQVQGMAYGFRLYYCNYAHGTYSLTEPRAKVYNNMFIQGDQGSSTRYGAYIYNPRYLDFWHNNIMLNSTSSSTRGIYLSTSTSYPDVDIRNNMIASANASSSAYMLYITEMGVITGLDYNLYYSPAGETSTMFYLDGSTYDWNTLPKTTWDAHSVWGNPYFEDDLTNLHSRSPSGYLKGIGIPEVGIDYDGDARNLATPCIGADEYQQPPDEYDAAVLKTWVSYAPNVWTRHEGSATHTISALIENVGLVDDPATIQIGISDAPMNNIGDAQLVETFSPNWDATHRAVVQFSNPLTGLTATPNGMLYTRIFLPNEQNPSNDQYLEQHPVHTTKVYGYEDFYGFEDGTKFTLADGYLDIPGWTTVDNNGGDAPEFMSEMYMMTGSSNAADEWLITPGAPILGAYSYRVGFSFDNYTNVPVTIEVAYGMSPSPNAMTTFATFSNVGMGSFTAKQLWQMTGQAGDPYFNTQAGQDGVYYIGIHVMTSATGYQWSLDNIKFDDNPTPPPRIAYGLPGDPILDFIDTEDPPIEIMANYKQPGLINRIYQVASSTNIYGPNGDFLWAVETKDPWMTVTTEQPDPTLQGYNFLPPRPRQFQNFTLTIDPSGLAPGVHKGTLVFYGILFNDDFPPPSQGLVALNEPLRVPVELRIIDTGTKGTKSVLSQTVCPMSVAGSPYRFRDPQTNDPIATVWVRSGSLKCMTIRAYPAQLPQNLERKRYVRRYWQVDYDGTGWKVDIDFPYADSEAWMILDRNQLRGIRQPAPLSAWEDPIFGTTSVSDPMLATVRVHGLTELNIGGNLALAHPYVLDRSSEGPLPTAFGLLENYPNPFNPSTRITYAMKEDRHVRITVYNQLGIEVAQLVDGVMPAGRHEVDFDASGLATGTYICRMITGDFVQTMRMTLTK